MTSPSLELATQPAAPYQRRAALFAIAGLTLLSVLAIPFARHDIGTLPAFPSFWGGTVLMGLAVSAMILFGQFSMSRKRSLLVLSCGLLFSVLVFVPYTLTVAGNSPVAALRALSQTSPYFFLMWHTALPASFAAYALLAPLDHRVRVSSAHALAAGGATIVAAYLAMHLLFAFAGVLPPLVRGNAYQLPIYAGFAVTIALSAFAFVRLGIRRARCTVVDVWLCVSAAALTLEAGLNAFGTQRYSVAWYCACIDVFVATTFFVVALIVETNRASRALAASEQRLRRVVDGVADALVVVDERGKIVSMNGPASVLFGFEAEDLAGSPIARIVPEYAAAAHDVPGGVTQTVGRDANGHVFAVELAIGRETAHPDETILILRDITQRKAAEDAIRAAHDRAVEAANVKAQFLAMMSHEIRTPINAVVGMSELLLATPLDDEAREYAITVRDSAESLLAIVNDILDFSKIEAGHMELEAVPFAPVVAVENATDILAAAARKKGLSLSTYVAPDVPARVLGDADRLRQVLLNLIGNAVKFTAHGSVMVRTTVERTGEQVVLRFSVTDTGPGIARDAGERLFEPFRQADQSTRRRYGGTGLGLSISRRIVALMGGHIGFDSSPGRGSTFWFTVPFPRVPDEARIEHAEMLRGTRVLVVDDDAVARQVVDQYLLSWGAVASSTGTAAHAFELAKAAAARRSPFDAIVIDRAVGGDGYAFAARMQSEPLLASIPLVLVSGATERVTSQDARARGFAASVRKPLRQHALHDALVTAIRGPVVPPAAIAAATAVEARDDVRILVAEDNPVNRKLALQQLKRLGFRAHAVSDGREAVEAAATGEYALVLMDCQMPDMDGFEATREIRHAELESGTHLAIVAMTANALEGDREACIAAGMDGYLAKPVQLSELRAVVDKYTSGVGVAG